MGRDELKNKSVFGKNSKRITLVLISILLTLSFYSTNATACGCWFNEPEFEEGKDVYGDIGPQKTLTIVLSVYADGINSDCIVYTYTISPINITPSSQEKFVGAYDVVTFSFQLFFNYSSDVKYFENTVTFYLYSEYCHNIVDEVKYKAEYDERDDDGDDKDEIEVNVNNSLIFTMEQAGVLKMIAFGLIGGFGILCLINFMRVRSEEILSKEERDKKKYKKAERMNLFCGISILLTLFIQYTTANIFYPFPASFDWMWGNEIYGLIIAGIVFFGLLVPYKKYFIIGSIVTTGFFFSIYFFLDFNWLMYSLFAAGVILAIFILFDYYWDLLAESFKTKKNKLARYNIEAPEVINIEFEKTGRFK